MRQAPTTDCAVRWVLSGPRYALYGLPVFEIRWSHVQPGGSSVLPSTLGGNLAGFAGATSSSLERSTTEGVVDGDMSKSSSLSACAFAAAASDAGTVDGAEGGKGGGGLVPHLQDPMPSNSRTSMSFLRTSCLRVRVSGHRRFWSGEEAPSLLPRPSRQPPASVAGPEVASVPPRPPTGSACRRAGPTTRAAPGTRLHSSVDRSPFCTKLALQVHVSRAGGARLGPGSSFVLQPPSQMRSSGAL
mmetsp:Transcript_74591/g.189284  ORF Transcript_74591/g.189284 Transcript_74591/m.189284 type:complete len:244 (+) Transcript_74591:501-1232(+)